MMIVPYRTVRPIIAQDVFIAQGAAVIGNVHIGKQSNVWFGCVIRGDVNYVRIGERTNVQDGTVIHVTRTTGGECVIGSGITIGHSALLHACTLEDDCFIGMHATILDGAIVESGAWVAAGALVPPGKRITKGQIWAGNPARPLRDMRQEERVFIAQNSKHYVGLAAEYLVAEKP